MKNPIYIIQPANEADAFAIASINVVSWQKAYRGIFSDEALDSLSVEQWATAWKASLQNNAIAFTISLAGKIVGFSLLCKDKSLSLTHPEQGEISAIYLHPNSWRKGLGKQLCLASLIELQKLGFKDAMLWTLEKNINAIKFYQSLGFKESGLSRICKIAPSSNLRELQYIKTLDNY